MKAAIVEKWGDASALKIGSVSDPQIDPSRVIVRLKISGLNHLDIWVRKGMPFLNISLPHVLGGDGAGTIEHVVKMWNPGK